MPSDETTSHDGVENDGGTAVDTAESVSLFETMSAEKMTKRDRYRHTLNEWLIAPVRIMWEDWRARVGGFIILFYILMGTVGTRIVPPLSGTAPRLLRPFENMAHPLGTDSTGTDLLRHTVHATPPMLEMILAGAVFATLLGTVVGVSAGYLGGRKDRLLMTFTDILMTIPGLPLVIVVSVILEPSSPWFIGVILTVNAWAGLARSVRSQVLTIKTESFVEASSLMGLSTTRILSKDIVPNVMPYVLANFVKMARRVVFASVGLYFLGVLPSTFPNWGVMLERAYSGGALYAPSLAYWLVTPMIAIVLISFGFILFAQGMDRIFNPRVRARHVSDDEQDGSRDSGSGGTGTTNAKEAGV